MYKIYGQVWGNQSVGIYKINFDEINFYVYSRKDFLKKKSKQRCKSTQLSSSDRIDYYFFSLWKMTLFGL